MALGAATSWMDMEPSEVSAKLKSLGNGQVGKVLVAEDEHLPLRGEKRELVLASVRELAELHAGDASPNGGCDVVADDAVLEDFGEGRVRANATVGMLE